MNIISYNIKRHIELLKYEKKVKSQNKSFFKENQIEFLELSKYDAAVDQHIFWENHFEVASLIQAFLNKEIDGEGFHDSVFGLRSNHIAKCEKFLSKLVSEDIKEFFPNEKSYKLKGFLSSLYFECEHFEMNFDEEEFYTSVRNYFLKFQKIIKKSEIFHHHSS
jgi:hypothetical protein